MTFYLREGGGLGGGAAQSSTKKTRPAVIPNGAKRNEESEISHCHHSLFI
jgi:hypothetical protein